MGHSSTLSFFITDVTCLCPVMTVLIRYSDHSLWLTAVSPVPRSTLPGRSLVLINYGFRGLVQVAKDMAAAGREWLASRWPRNVVVSSDASPFVSLTRNVENPQPQPRPR